MLGGEEGLEYEVCANEIHLEHVSEFKYLRCGLDESGIMMFGVCTAKWASGRPYLSGRRRPLQGSKGGQSNRLQIGYR